MSCFRLLENYCWVDDVDITVTSESADFPASNLKKFFRANTWRSNATGYFKIESGVNDKIDFSDGSTKVATITAGDYNATTLSSEIKTQMESASSDVFTISFSIASGLWTFSSNGSTFELLWDSGINSGTSIGSDLGFDTSSDDTGALTYTAASIAIHSSFGESVVIDLKTTEEVDSFMMFFDPNIGNQLSEAAVVKLQGNHTNVWSSPAVDITLSFDDNVGIYSHFFSNAQSYRYWRVNVVDPTNPNLYVSFGKVFLSTAIALTRLPEIGFEFSVQDLSRFQENEYGNRFVDIFPTKRSLSLAFNLMSEDDAEEFFRFYDRTGASEPIVAVLDTSGDFLNTNRYCIYGYCGLQNVFTHQIRDIFSSTFVIEETF